LESPREVEKLIDQKMMVYMGTDKEDILGGAFRNSEDF